MIGGSASGKSDYAERHVLSLEGGGPRIYIATMEPFGEEARARIARHHAMRRDRGFETIECYRNIGSLRLPADSNVLLEDLGNLMANELFGNDAAADYEEDLTAADAVGNTVETRLAMYTPLYYLLESSDGYETSEVAKYWRIRTGIAQSDCALSTEMNLALALENYSGVENVDFETVWGAGHTQAERTGSSTDNFIAWVNECMSEA